jgi:hypothetical protein
MSQRRSRSILPQFVPEFPLERNDHHRAVRHGHRLPTLAITPGGRLPRRTKYLTDLGRSKAQEPDNLYAVPLGDPPNHAHGRESPPLDTLRRLRGRERNRATLRYTPPEPRSRKHLQESPNRQAVYLQPHQERLTRAAQEAAPAPLAAANDGVLDHVIVAGIVGTHARLWETRRAAPSQAGPESKLPYV